ncbi:MAG: hypothetical protein E5X41_31750 [Mesorhizobium sp.]|nr:MAG: hypothetical protein E5X41_31750 [Mesorhizobium sp.]
MPKSEKSTDTVRSRLLMKLQCHWPRTILAMAMAIAKAGQAPKTLTSTPPTKARSLAAFLADTWGILGRRPGRRLKPAGRLNGMVGAGPDWTCANPIGPAHRGTQTIGHAAFARRLALSRMAFFLPGRNRASGEAEPSILPIMSFRFVRTAQTMTAALIAAAEML